MVLGGLFGAVLTYVAACTYGLSTFYTSLLTVLGYVGGDVVEDNIRRTASKGEVNRAYPEYNINPASA